MRWFIGLCSVVTLLGVGGMTARPAAADPLPAIVFAHPEPFIVDDPEQDAVAKEVMRKGFAQKMAVLAKGLPGWECVGVGASGAPMVELSFVAQKYPEEFGDKRYLLTLSLFVSNKGREGLVRPGYGDLQVIIDLNDPTYAEEAKSDDPAVILREWGKARLDDLMKKFKPCFVRSEIMAKSTVRYEDQYAIVNTETNMASLELELMLDENGAFAAEGPTAMQFTGTIAPGPAMLALRSLPSPPPPCVFETVQLSGQQPLTLSMAGTYRDDDASLVYDSITVAETGPSKLTATGGCAAGMIPPEIDTGMAAGDLLASGEHAQPLQDGAVLALPRADFMPPEVSWEGTVTLTYEPEVGSTPPTQPAE